MGVNWIESELATHRARSVCVSIGPWRKCGTRGAKRERIEVTLILMSDLCHRI